MQDVNKGRGLYVDRIVPSAFTNETKKIVYIYLVRIIVLDVHIGKT